MFNKIDRSLMVGMVLIMLTILVVFSSVALSQPTADSISVASDTGENNQTIQVPVNITNVANGALQVIMFDVNYTHSVVDIVAVTNGDLLPLDPITQQPKWTVCLGGNHESVTLSTSDQTTALQNGSTGTIAVLWVSVIGTVGQQTGMNLTNIDVSSTDLKHGTIPSIYGTFTVAGATKEADAIPPSTTDHDPASGATGVPIDTNITVHVLDDGDCVNDSTIVMTVDDAVVTPEITGTSADYTLFYDPPADFSYDQLVNVTIDASDLNETPNVMATDEYSFTTESTPVTYPTADSISVASDTGENNQTIQVPVNITNVANGALQVIMFDVNYTHSVVDIVAVTNGDLLPLDPITQQPKWTVCLGGNHESVTLSTSDQTTALQNGSTGTIAVLWVSVIGTVGQQTGMNLTNIDVSSTDLKHGTIPSIYGTFTVAGATKEADAIPPSTTDHDPASGATGVPIDTNITVHVLDDGDCVNDSTIVMTVDDAVVTPEITGTSADALAYDPPADRKIVNVTIDVSKFVPIQHINCSILQHQPYEVHFAPCELRVIGGNDEASQPDLADRSAYISSDTDQLL